MNEFAKFYSNKSLHEMLTNGINSGLLCHAYLFYGKNGIGKKTLSRYVAMGVLCRSTDATKPCYTCSSCHKVLNDCHPDLVFVDSKDAKNSIHIDEIRQIRQDAYISPNESDYKVYVIPNVENMSIGAANALLKVLEEPPKTAMFILTASAKSAVIPTILSRCVPLCLYPLSDGECMEALDERFPDATSEKKASAAQKSQGILGMAIELMAADGDSVASAVIDGIIAKKEYSILKALSSIKSDRTVLNVVIDELMLIVRAGMLVKLGVKSHTSEQERALAFGTTLDASRRYVEVLQRASELNDGNASVSLLCAWLATKLIV